MTLTDAEYAYLRSELGEAERADLETRYQRLGSLQAVATEVLRERKAALISDPLAVTVQEVATVNNAENVKALERQIAAIEGDGSTEADYLAPVPLQRRQAR